MQSLMNIPIELSEHSSILHERFDGVTTEVLKLEAANRKK